MVSIASSSPASARSHRSATRFRTTGTASPPAATEWTITLFDASAHACRFAAEVKDFDPSGFIEPKEAKRWDRFCKFGVVAAKQAVAHAGLEINDANADRIGTIIGSGVGGLLTMETQAHVLEGRGPGRVSPFTVPMMIPNMATGLAAIALGTKGPSSAVATACAAGSNAVGDAFRLLQIGKADAMVSGVDDFVQELARDLDHDDSD